MWSLSFWKCTMVLMVSVQVFWKGEKVGRCHQNQDTNFLKCRRVRPKTSLCFSLYSACFALVRSSRDRSSWSTTCFGCDISCYPAKSGILQSPSCVCFFVSRISQKLLVGFWRNLVSREVMIIGRPSSTLGVIRIEIRIWDPDNCFSWTTGRIFGSGFQSDPG